MPNYEVLKDVSIDGFPNAKAGMVLSLSEEVAAIHVEAGELKLSTDASAKVYVPGQIPTAGRIVYYNDGALYPAIVVSVGDDGKLSILVAYLQGWTPKHGVQQGSDAGMWDWMPFQKDQQARLSSVQTTTSIPKQNGVSDLAGSTKGAVASTQSTIPATGSSANTTDDKKTNSENKA